MAAAGGCVALAIAGHDHAGDLQLALGTAGAYGLDSATAGRIITQVRLAVGTWAEKAKRLELSRQDCALIEPILRANC
jgi:hypothetical protein